VEFFENPSFIETICSSTDLTIATGVEVSRHSAPTNIDLAQGAGLERRYAFVFGSDPAATIGAF
jgi:hypothetical protein